MFYSEDWHFDKPKKTGQYMCLIKFNDEPCIEDSYTHEILDFFKEGEDAGVEYADKHNFWARLYDETWEWFEVPNVVAWQYLTFPTEFNQVCYKPMDGGAK